MICTVQECREIGQWEVWCGLGSERRFLLGNVAHHLHFPVCKASKKEMRRFFVLTNITAVDEGRLASVLLREARTLIEGHVLLRAVQYDLVAAQPLANVPQVLNQPMLRKGVDVGHRSLGAVTTPPRSQAKLSR